MTKRNHRCRLFGHRMWIINDKEHPLNITLGCLRCYDPSTFTTLVKVIQDPSCPGYVVCEGFDKLAGRLAAQ